MHSPMRTIPPQMSSPLAVFLLLLLLVITVAGLTWLGVNPFWGKERIPFEDLRWKQGYVEVLLDGEWSRLLSVNDVKTERLIDRSVAEWGPAYQDRFVPEFNLLMEKENGGLNILCKLTISTPDGEKSNWSLSIPRRYWACRDAIATRQSVKREPIRLAQGDVHSTRPVNRKFSRDDSGWVSRGDALEDIRYFEWCLEHRYAYLAKSKTPYQTLLDDIVNDMEEGISRRDLALRLEKILALFEDIHTGISFGASRIRLAEKIMPSELIEVDGKIACLKPDRLSYLDPDYPFLKSINKVPLVTIENALSELAARKGDSQKVLKYLKMTEFIMALTGQLYDGKASLELESADGKNTRTVTLTCVPPETIPDFTLPVESRILKGAIGYLALRKRLFPGEQFKNEIIRVMTGFQHTNGMILDLRGNEGGQRDAIPLLLNYFVPPDELPMLLAVAAVRMDSAVRPPSEVELLQSRMLWSKSWKGWTARERQLIQEEEKKFIPSLSLHDEGYSDPYFMVVGEHTGGAYYYHNKVIVLHDSGSVSAAGLLLSTLKGKKNIQLMGSLSNSDSGYPQADQLPHSRIVYWLSSMASFKPDGSLLDKVEPDISYELTLHDLNQMITHGADPLMEKAAERLRE